MNKNNFQKESDLNYAENMVIIEGHKNTDVVVDKLKESSLVMIDRKRSSKQWKRLARGESSTPHDHDSGAVIVGEGKRTRDPSKQDADINKKIKLDSGAFSTSEDVYSSLRRTI